MTRRITLLTIGFLAIGLADVQRVHAQADFTGTWRVEAAPPWTVVFRQNGANVTGRVSQCSSMVSTDISGGRIVGNTVSFKCLSTDGDRTVTLTGTRDGDAIAFEWTMAVRPGGATADENARGRSGILGPSSPSRFIARRVPDGVLAVEADGVRGREFAAAVNLPAEDVKGHALLLLPEAVGRIRGAIVIIDWGLGAFGYSDAAWQKLSERLQFPVLLTRFRDFRTPNAFQIGPGRLPKAGSARALELLLQRLADESSHPELATAPLVFWGHSAAGGQVSSLASELSSRTIGFVRYHSGGTPVGDVKTMSQVPALIVVAGKDGDVAERGDAEVLWRRGHATGAQWTFAIEPEATYGDPSDVLKANDFVLTWMASVTNQRLAGNEKTLRPITADLGWLGDIRTGEIAPHARFGSSDKQNATWLPDEASATAWQRLVRPK